MRFPNSRLLLLCCGSAFVALTGCASAPLSYVQGKSFNRIDSHLFSVRVVSIDGSLQFRAPAERINIEPGLRSLVLESAPMGIAKKRIQKSMSLLIEPCMSYDFAAREVIGESDWNLVIASKEAVQDCNPELERKKAGLL